MKSNFMELHYLYNIDCRFSIARMWRDQEL